MFSLTGLPTKGETLLTTRKLLYLNLKAESGSLHKRIRERYLNPQHFPFKIVCLCCISHNFNEAKGTVVNWA